MTFPREPFAATRQRINETIFQAYDIRAIADQYLDDDIIFYLGKAYGSFLRRSSGAPSGSLWVNVGGGIRLSTERIRPALIEGLLSAGINVHNIGVSTTPELYFSIPFLEADGGINITASHNEAEYNGLKQAIRDQHGYIVSINAEMMLEIKRTVLEGDFLDGSGKTTVLEPGVITEYHNLLVKSNIRLGRASWIYLLASWRDRGLRRLLDTLKALDFPEAADAAAWQRLKDALGLPQDAMQPATAIKRPLAGLKAVIDYGNGSAARTSEIYTDLGVAVVALNETPDGSFPAHIPDPIKAQNRAQMVEAVLAEAARETSAGGQPEDLVAIGFDEDADRVIFLRSDGAVVEGDRALCIQARPVIADHQARGKPGKPRFIGEVKLSRVADEYISALGGEFIVIPTGFAFAKEAVKTIDYAIKTGRSQVEVFGKKVDLARNKQTVVLAAELSGHQMWGHEENWIFDDAAFAAAKLLDVIARSKKQGHSFIELDEDVPRYPVSPEINIRLSTNLLTEKRALVESILEIYTRKGYPIDRTDGGIIKWLDASGDWLGQAVVRKSNTQPMIICRVEARDQTNKTRIEDEFFSDLSRFAATAAFKLDLTSDAYVANILNRTP